MAVRCFCVHHSWNQPYQCMMETPLLLQDGRGKHSISLTHSPPPSLSSLSLSLSLSGIGCMVIKTSLIVRYNCSSALDVHPLFKGEVKEGRKVKGWIPRCCIERKTASSQLQKSTESDDTKTESSHNAASNGSQGLTQRKKKS